MPDITNVSVPLIAIILVLREVLTFLRRRNDSAGSPDVSRAHTGANGKNGGRAVMESRVADIDRRTEEIAAAIRALLPAITELTQTFRETAKSVERLLERVDHIKEK